MVDIWRAKKAEVYIGPAISPFSSTSTIMAQLTGHVTYSGEVKDIEISGGEADTETIYLFGSNTSGQQNAVKDPQNMTDLEFTGTLIFKDHDTSELATATAASVGSTGYKRISGDGDRSEKAVVIKFNSGSDTAVVLLNNALFTKMGDISLEAEGHAEQEIMAKCLAKDYHVEDNFGT